MQTTKAKRASKINLTWDEKSAAFTATADGQKWEWAKDYAPHFTTKGGDVLFSEAKEIKSEPWKTGIGSGFRTTYSGFTNAGEAVPFAFTTIAWVEDSSQDVFFEWIPLCDEGFDVTAVYWPGHMAFEEKSPDWYSVLTELQGLLLPNNWEAAVNKVVFDGQLCCAAAYMPWFGQVNPEAGYIAIATTPWDAAYQVDHPAEGPYSHVGIRWLPSLGKMNYARTIRFTFMKDCDYNDICKVYRHYVKETGHFVSLAEKTAKNPLVDKLIGSVVVHNGIKTHIAPGSDFFDADHPEKNDVLTPFSERTAKMLHFKEKGVKKLYFHLDGWGQPGYDNQHPDYLPACKEAGGWEGFKELSDTMEACNYMLGVHDQYRDYYFDAATFDPQFGLLAADGSRFEMARWAGGRQTYLCATQAPYYVKRNFQELLDHGIHLEGTYLDVFTCNEPDECANPLHRMTRRECLEYRGRCFDYLTSKGILPSSEEVTDWSANKLVFAHYGPYDFMLRAPEAPRSGINVPLFNLVYHDSLILPWFMDRHPGVEDYMLYALLNAGIPYLDKEGAYPNTDGAFDNDAVERQLEEDISRCQVVTDLHERLAKCELVRHEILGGDWHKQTALYSDGTEVTIDLAAGTYNIKTI